MIKKKYIVAGAVALLAMDITASIVPNNDECVLCSYTETDVDVRCVIISWDEWEYETNWLEYASRVQRLQCPKSPNQEALPDYTERRNSYCQYVYEKAVAQCEEDTLEAREEQMEVCDDKINPKATTGGKVGTTWNAHTVKGSAELHGEFETMPVLRHNSCTQTSDASLDLGKARCKTRMIELKRSLELRLRCTINE